jgi:hypothetical protein
MYFYVSVHLIFHARLFSLLRNVISTNINAQAMLPSGARFLALDELDPSTQFCADPEVHFRMLGKKITHTLLRACYLSHVSIREI